MALAQNNRLTGQTRKLPSDLNTDYDAPPHQRRRLNNGQSQPNTSNTNHNNNNNNNNNSNNSSHRPSHPTHQTHHTPQHQHHQHQQQQQQHQHAQQATGLHRLMEFRPRDDLECKIREFIAAQMTHGSRNNVEIETKLGLFLKTGASHELSLENSTIWSVEEKKRRNLRKYSDIGINSTAIIDTNKSPATFHSQVPPNVFKHLNQVLNNWYVNAMSAPKSRKAELRNMLYPKIGYSRITEIDKLYSDKVRVSLGIDKPGHIKRCIQKDRLEDLNILFPRSGFDLRISSNLEHKVPKPDPVKTELKCVRTKDRIGYKWDLFEIDISTIHSYNTDLNPSFIEKLRTIMFNNKKNKKSPSLGLPHDHGCEVSYEIELEIIDTRTVGNARDFCFDRQRLQAIQDPNERMRKQKQFYDICFVFMQHSLQLSELASQPGFIPRVCQLPNAVAAKK